MNYNTICAQRIAGALGAEIAGVDLSRPLSAEVIGEIRQALLDHQVIFFHDQHLTPEQHLAFGRRFGELQIHDFLSPVATAWPGGWRSKAGSCMSRTSSLTRTTRCPRS